MHLETSWRVWEHEQRGTRWFHWWHTINPDHKSEQCSWAHTEFIDESFCFASSHRMVKKLKNKKSYHFWKHWKTKGIEIKHYFSIWLTANGKIETFCFHSQSHILIAKWIDSRESKQRRKKLNETFLCKSRLVLNESRRRISSNLGTFLRTGNC